MTRKRHAAEGIVAKLRQVDVLMAQAGSHVRTPFIECSATRAAIGATSKHKSRSRCRSATRRFYTRFCCKKLFGCRSWGFVLNSGGSLATLPVEGSARYLARAAA
jgi:hypothetical protein